VDNAMTGPRGPKPKRRFSRNNIFIYGTLLMVSMYYLLPLYVMIVTSLKGMPEIRMGNVFSPPVGLHLSRGAKHGHMPAQGSIVTF